MSDTEALPEIPDWMLKADWFKDQKLYEPETDHGHRIGTYNRLTEDNLTFHKLMRRAVGEPHITEEADEFVPVQGLISEGQCHVCGERCTIEVNFATYKYRITSAPCEYPQGVPCVVRLEVPSGVIVAENDFRPLLFSDRDDDPAGDLNVNIQLDMVKTTQVYAQHKMIQAFVGNTCPGIYQMDEKNLHVSNSGWVEETDEEITPPGKQVGSICTDLWWYSLMDRDEFERLGGNDYYKVWEESGHWTKPDFINVTPGVYEITHYACLKSFDRDAPGVTRWSDIAWVEPICTCERASLGGHPRTSTHAHDCPWWSFQHATPEPI